ncbi:hypothetical protein B296_00042377 [Ensete ventricosum]|uniref:Uncharacterized protein n=1 Tax=Ensete ventricosum TaxID=4639 RepID=A0A426YJT7_ENSVE|nr:hypothetical protein B296_00042377 [Ensete ventricosum]
MQWIAGGSASVDYNKARQNGSRVEHKHLIQIRVRSCCCPTRRIVLLLFRFLAPPHPACYDPAHQHRNPLVVLRRDVRRRIMRSPARGHGPYPPRLVRFESLPYDAAEAALRNRVAQVGDSVQAEGAPEGGAVKPQELVAVGGGSRVPLRQLAGFALYAVPVILEPRHRLPSVADFEDPLYSASWCSFLQPTRLEYDLDYLPTGVLGPQLRH